METDIVSTPKRIAVLQGSSQKGKNSVLYEACRKAAESRGSTVVNFGIFAEEDAAYSYPEIAVMISLLLSSGSADFAVTGCSSGQGMALACNCLPGVLCGYIQNPQDAFLFGRINGGNAASFSLGLNYGWLGELNLQYSMEKLFDGDFGMGYPPESAERKSRDARTVKQFNNIAKKPLTEVLEQLDAPLIRKALSRRNVIQFVLENSRDQALTAWIEQQQSSMM